MNKDDSYKTISLKIQKEVYDLVKRLASKLETDEGEVLSLSIELLNIIEENTSDNVILVLYNEETGETRKITGFN